MSIALLTLCGVVQSITSGDGRIPIASTPNEAKVTIYDMNKTVVAIGTTPVEIKLKKGSGYFQGADYRLVVEKTGFQTREFKITHKLNGW